MEELRQTFLADSIAALENLRPHLEKPDFFAGLGAEMPRELARALHTIKGTAQTFGFPVSALLAHTLENLLAAAAAAGGGGGRDSISPREARSLLAEGIEILSASLADANFQIPDSLIEKLRPFQTAMRAANSPATADNRLPEEIPESLAAQLSAAEKIRLKEVLGQGNNLAVLEIGFAADRFTEEFKKFREKLSEKGEIVAALPSAKFAAQNKIGFQIVFASSADASEAVENTEAEIRFQISQIFPAAVAAEGEPEFLAQIVRHGKALAANLGKNIEFETFCDRRRFSPPETKIIFDAVLHLVRNAVDHGIERAGRVTIQIAAAATTGEKKIRVKVGDDGRGLDSEKIRRKAIEKKLIAPDAVLSEPEIFDLIFAHGFSTGERVTEISGRGVGLDAVKDAVERAGGEISVESKPGEGTAFVILLPKE